jgi:DNA repair exonuclease SbcCD nuclease subunit
VLLAHGSIGGSVIGAESSTAFLREAVLPLPELQGLAFRYQAWGHLHRQQLLSSSIRYAGSIERVDFAEAEEDKGWWLLGFWPEKPDSYTEGTAEWRSSSPRRFVDLDLGEDLEQGVDELFSENVAGAVVRVRYTATPEIARTVDHAAIIRTLKAGGAVKVHGPIPTITQSFQEANPNLTEETDIWTAWQEWATANGLDGEAYERLSKRVLDALGEKE